MRKLKKLVSRKSGTKPIQPSQTIQPPAPAQPSISNSAPSSHDDPWILAYEKLQNRKPELMADYKKHLASLQGTTAASADLSTPRSVEDIVTQQLKTRESKQWQVGLLGKEVKVREAIEKLVKFSLWADSVVKDAVSAQPYAALAWSGVSLLLPLLASGTIQNVAMLKTFGLIGDIQLYWKICEDTYLQPNQRGDYQALVEPLAGVYSQILECQARVICHLSKAQLSRGWDDVVGANDWNGLTEQVNQSSERCKELIGPLREEEARSQWMRQLQEMEESRVILDEIRQILDENGSQAQEIYEDKAERALLQDLASNYQGDKNFNPRKVDGTCEWFFVDDRFRSWRDEDTSRLLWVTAGPGCGKSVLSRALIDEGRLSNNVTSSNICYFFFKDGIENRMNSADAICALLHQLFTQDTSGKLFRKALTSHKNYGNSLTSNFSELWKIFTDCATSTDAAEIVCVLDALDECKTQSRRQLIDHLQDFYSHSDPSSRLKFFITSRPEVDLEISFGDFTNASIYLRFDGDEKFEDVSDDINRVIDHEMKEIARGFTDEDRLKISRRLKSTNDRTYLWLYLTLAIIKQNGDRRRVDIESTLDVLAGTVADQYERLLNRSTNRAHAESLLRIVLAAERALTIDEANVALTLALQHEFFPSHATLISGLWSKENFISTVKNTCGLLVSTHDSKLSFLHQTAREFLLHPDQRGCWQGRFKISESNSTMYRSCIDFLVLPGIPYVPSDATPEGVSQDSDHLPPFLYYSAVNWLSHRTKQQTQDTSLVNGRDLSAAVLKLCDPKSECYSTWSHVYERRNRHVVRKIEANNHLGIAAYLGLEEAVTQLLNTSEVDDLDAEDELGRTPLFWAASRGYEVVVKQLLDTGKVNVNATDRSGRTPVFWAAARGRQAVVDLLLTVGNADVNVRDKDGRTPLSWAVANGEVVQQLLDTGKVDDVDPKDDRGRTPLHCAIEQRNEAVVKRLLDTGKIDIGARSCDGQTPLTLAMMYERKAIVKLLQSAASKKRTGYW